MTDELLTDPEERFLNGEDTYKKISLSKQEIDLNGTAVNMSDNRGTTPMSN